MINNNIYALLIGVGDYKKIKITDIPSYRMDVALIGTGLISGLKCTQEHIEQSLDMFTGHGIAVYASSADDEVSRLGPNGNHSMFTGALSSAMIFPSIVHKGQIALEDIYRETQRLVHAWNIKNPGKEQHPIYRSSMGGTAYFKVAEYKPYEPEQISKEDYISQCKKYMKLFVDKAEDFCVDLMEVYNCKLSFSELQRRYKEWVIKVKHEFIQLSDMEVASEEIHDWVEEIMQLLGWRLDLSIYLEGDKQSGTITDREEWLIQNTIKKYHESLEKLKELEMNIK